MPSYNIVTDLVRKALREKPLPDNFWDLPERDRRPFIDRAAADGGTPEALYAVVRDKQAADFAESGFDPVAIAKAVRSR